MQNPFNITDDGLKTLLGSFSEWVKTDKDSVEYARTQRDNSSRYKRVMLNTEALRKTSDEELYKLVFAYSRELEGPVMIRLGEQRLKAELKKIKRNLEYIASSPDNCFEKAEKILDGQYAIKYFATAFWSPLLQAQYPEILPNWNNKTIRFMKVVGVDVSKISSVAAQYKAISDAFLYLRSLDDKNDFYTLNHLMHYGTVIEEGIGVINSINNKSGNKVKYWLIQPGKNADKWDEFYENKIIGIGWDYQNLGDLKGKSLEDVRKAFAPEDKSKPEGTNRALICYQFANEMKEGDILFVKSGLWEIIGYGTVKSDYKYDKDRNTFKHIRKVSWTKNGHWNIDNADDIGIKQFPIKTLTDISDYPQLLGSLNKLLGINEAINAGGEMIKFKGFTKEAFDVLARLSKDTSYEAVFPIKDEIGDKVTKPLRAMLKEIGSTFDERDMLNLEKETGIVSNLWKFNPKLGTYKYLWGAFYQKGASRITSNQLFVMINEINVVMGVYPAEKNKEVKERLLNNLKENAELLEEYIPKEFFKKVEFFEDAVDNKPRKMHIVNNIKDLTELYQRVPLNVGKILKKEEVIELGEKIESEIKDVFEYLIPLYIFGITDNPRKILEAYYSEVPVDEPEVAITKEELLKEIFMDSDRLDDILSLLENNTKRQIILQGPPGTGKTFIAQNLSNYLTQSKERIEIIQFHPSYSYEDFIEGYRPQADKGFILNDGIFKTLCYKAKSNPEKTYVLIIDEINRGNLSKIFGELMFLLEYRDKEVKLTYSQKPFSIPKNLIIIGTMNTADRSLAIMDYALRRRFCFITLQCQYEGLKIWLEKHGSKISAKVIKGLEELNKDIETNMNSKCYSVGHSYFMVPNLDKEKLEEIKKYQVKPLLEEYFFDQSEKAEEIIQKLDI